jgi:hypothetical protein
MRIWLTNPPGICADGSLTGVVVSEQATPFPHIVLQMRVKGAPEEGHPVEVTLDEIALFTIVQAMRKSNVERIRDILS